MALSSEHTVTKAYSAQLLVSGFVGLIGLGTVLLILPYSTVDGISLIDALFTATSAVCVTGLIVKAPYTEFTTFGNLVILILIQIGGVGYMSMATLMALIAGRRIGLFERIMIRESMNITSLEGIVRFIKRMLIFVFLVEASGALLLGLIFMDRMPAFQAFMFGIFHSISAFNNAGFSLFSDSFIGYRNNLPVNLILMVLIVTGGIGFIVFEDLSDRLTGKKRHLMQHTRVVLTATLILLTAGTAVIYLTERHYLFSSTSAYESLLSSLFASVTARTAGFNTIEYSLLQPQTLFFVIILMFIGASPGSTGGGIKTTTFTVVLMHVFSTLRGKRDTVLFKRRVPEVLISRSLVIMSLAVLYITLMTFVIEDIEHTGFLATMFEVVSAFGTVGLSVGNPDGLSLSASFSTVSKLAIIITMLVGRLGPLTLFTAILKQKEERIRYPAGKLIIG